ncbi:hypothetical protein K3495_g15505 [Podosphaera aphanis]|nr:hypothetical protein K3495_g15505 [Podosphaera aphanis]
MFYQYFYLLINTRLTAWFASQPRSRNLIQGQVSVILSDKYRYLDSDPQNKSKLNSKRNYLREHEELELVLFEWQQRMQGKRVVITRDIIKAKARELWQRLTQYTPEMEEPKWSNGWLESFKKKFNIKQYVQHEEGAAADIKSDANIAQITELRDLCSRYPEKDIFNMDETGIFWMIAPTRSLATESTSGGGKNQRPAHSCLHYLCHGIGKIRHVGY